MATDRRYVKSENSSVSKNNMTLFYRESKIKSRVIRTKEINSSQWELGEKIKQTDRGAGIQIELSFEYEWLRWWHDLPGQITKRGKARPKESWIISNTK